MIFETGQKFRLAHLSDAHIGPLPRPRWNELIGKRLTGFMNWHNGRHNIHNMAVLRTLVQDIHAQTPDHVAMTGDILNIGLHSEFAPARDWLASVGAPDAVSFVPGNHDVYVHSNRADLVRFFAPWMAGGTFPYVRKIGPVAVIGLNSGVPTLPFVASGRLGKAQLKAFANLLKSDDLTGMARVVMIHHPPYASGARFARGLDDASAFEQIIAEHGAELVLHGHNHRAQVHFLPGPGNHVPVVGVASASAVPGSPHHLAAYHLYELSKQGAGWHISGRIRGSRPDDAGVHDLGGLSLSR